MLPPPRLLLATTLAIAGKVLSISRSFALNCLHFIDKHEEGEGILRFVYVALSGLCAPSYNKYVLLHEKDWSFFQIYQL